METVWSSSDKTSYGDLEYNTSVGDFWYRPDSRYGGPDYTDGFYYYYVD